MIACIAMNSLDFRALQYIKAPRKAWQGVVFQLIVGKNFCIANIFPVRKFGEIWNLIMRNHQFLMITKESRNVESINMLSFFVVTIVMYNV